MSTREEKLAEYARAWMDADGRYNDDVQAAAGDAALIQQIDAIWWTHQGNWAMAATAALEKNNSLTTSLVKDAKAANDDVTSARERRKALSVILQSSAKAANALSKLLTEVAKI